MSKYRPIAPVPGNPVKINHDSKKRQRHTEEQWEKVKPYILDLYLVHHFKLNVVVENLATQGFNISESHLKHKIGQWGAQKKNNTPGSVYSNDSRERKPDSGDVDDLPIDANANLMQSTFFPAQAGFQSTPVNAMTLNPDSSRSSSDTSYISYLQILLRQEPLTKKIMFCNLEVTGPQLTEVYPEHGPWQLDCPHMNGHIAQLHCHQCGLYFAIGIGRFITGEEAEQLIWLLSGALEFVHPLLSLHSVAGLPMTSDLVQPGCPDRAVEFCVLCWQDISLPNSLMVLELLKQSSFVRTLVGSEISGSLAWNSTWKEIGAEETEYVAEQARRLFGDTSNSHLHLQTSCIIIKFPENELSGLPFWLRMTVAINDWSDHECHPECLAGFLLVEYVDDLGVVKVQVPLNHQDVYRWQNFRHLGSQWNAYSIPPSGRTWLDVATLSHEPISFRESN